MCHGLMIARKSATSATALIANDLVGNILATRKATKETFALIGNAILHCRER
jgi:hypothetical protein